MLMSLLYQHIICYINIILNHYHYNKYSTQMITILISQKQNIYIHMNHCRRFDLWVQLISWHTREVVSQWFREFVKKFAAVAHHELTQSCRSATRNSKDQSIWLWLKIAGIERWLWLRHWFNECQGAYGIMFEKIFLGA